MMSLDVSNVAQAPVILDDVLDLVLVVLASDLLE